jgi:hypothetical protein
MHNVWHPVKTIRLHLGIRERFLSIVFLILAGWFFLGQAHALIISQRGNRPVRDPGWPDGAVTVANLPLRVGWAEGPPYGGGQWTFYYRGDTSALQMVLEQFAAIQSDRLVVVLHEGTGSSPFVDTSYDWSFQVWVPTNWDRLYNNPQILFDAESPGFRQRVAAPRLDVWLVPGGLECERLKMPTNIMIEDARATSNGFKPGSGSAIRATLSDAATGSPISAATIVAEVYQNPQRYRVVTEVTRNNQEAIELANIPPGNYRIKTMAAGYVPRVLGNVRFGSNDFKEFNETMSRPVTATGIVVDETEHPLSGVKIKAVLIMGADGRGYRLPETPETISDNDGRFQLNGLPIGVIQVRASLSGYHHRCLPSDVIKVPNADDSPNPVLRMQATGKVRIQLIDEHGKLSPQRYGAVSVYIQAAVGQIPGSWGGAQNATNGVCVFEDVPPGEYRVSGTQFLRGENHTDAGSQPVTVIARKTVEVKLLEP